MDARHGALLTTPVLFVCGVLTTIFIGGLASMQVSVPVDATSPTSPWPAVGLSALVFGAFAVTYFVIWKATGHGYDERRGRTHFILTFIGVHTVLVPPLWLRADNLSRGYTDYTPVDTFAGANLITTVGVFILVVSAVTFVHTLVKAFRTSL